MQRRAEWGRLRLLCWQPAGDSLVTRSCRRCLILRIAARPVTDGRVREQEPVPQANKQQWRDLGHSSSHTLLASAVPWKGPPPNVSRMGVPISAVLLKGPGCVARACTSHSTGEEAGACGGRGLSACCFQRPASKGRLAVEDRPVALYPRKLACMAPSLS